MPKHRSQRLSRLLVAAGLACAGTAGGLALIGRPAGAAPANSCSDEQTMVVVEWHADAPPDPAAVDGISNRCATPGDDPYGALANAGFQPTYYTDSADRILCALLGQKCDGDAQSAPGQWTYWFLDAAGQWQGPKESPSGQSPTSPGGSPTTSAGASSGSGAVAPGADTGTTPGATPAVEDWVYAPDRTKPVHPAYVPAVPPSTPPPSTPPTTPPTQGSSGGGPSAHPSHGPSDGTGSSEPADQGAGGQPREPGSGPDPQTDSRGPADRSAAGAPRHAGTGPSAASGNAPDGAASAAAPDGSASGPTLPNADVPDDWSIAARAATNPDLARAGQVSQSASASEHSVAHRAIWSTALGAAALVLLAVGVAAQVRRRRAS